MLWMPVDRCANDYGRMSLTVVLKTMKDWLLLFFTNHPTNCNPVEAMYEFFSQFKIDLSIINVTCKGASAPMELLFNLMIMGVCIIIIESNFQSFRAITFNALTDAFIGGISQPSYNEWAYRSRGLNALKSWKGTARYAFTVISVVLARGLG